MSGEASGREPVGGDRRRLESELSRLTRDLEATRAEVAARDEALRRFTHSVGHDLKSPLATIRGFARLLSDDLEKGHAERIDADLGHLVEAVDAMERLLDELLERSRTEPPADTPEEIGPA